MDTRRARVLELLMRHADQSLVVNQLAAELKAAERVEITLHTAAVSNVLPTLRIRAESSRARSGPIAGLTELVERLSALSAESQTLHYCLVLGRRSYRLVTTGDGSYLGCIRVPLSPPLSPNLDGS